MHCGLRMAYGFLLALVHISHFVLVRMFLLSEAEIWTTMTTAHNKTLLFEKKNTEHGIGKKVIFHYHHHSHSF